MNRDKIRETLTDFYHYAIGITQPSGREVEIKTKKQAYQSAISELQSDVAVMRKITGKEKWDHNGNYILYNFKSNLFLAAFYDSRIGLFSYINSAVNLDAFTHYLQIELEE